MVNFLCTINSSQDNTEKEINTYACLIFQSPLNVQLYTEAYM